MEEDYVDPEAMAVINRLLQACPSFVLGDDVADLSWCAARDMGQHLTDLIDS
ncbi:MAG: hypothetical protein ACLQRH_04220 [Acidimicrobiales bacterium]